MMFVLNDKTLINMLTLRYNPLQEPLIPKITIEDLSNTQKVDIMDILNVLKEVIINKIINKNNLAIALSGGIDSTLLLAIIRDLFPDKKIDCLCAITDGYSEYNEAKIIADKFNCDIHPVYIERVLEYLPLQLSIIEEPRWNTYMYYVIKETKRYSNTLITGDGGDELFGGYTFRYSKFLKLLNDNDPASVKVMKYLECHERDWVPDQENVFGSKVKFSWEYIINLLKLYFDNNLEPLTQLFMADFNGKLLFDWMPTNTKILKYFNIEWFSPFLDINIIKLAMKIDPNLKFDINNNIGKLPLRKLLNKYDIIINNSKQGFVLDTRKILLEHINTIKYYLSDARVVRDEWINKEWVEKNLNLVEKNDVHIRYINKILGIFAFEIWYRLFITKEISANTKL
jgi:asparagine synthase (glutamine-hydrolysing)